MLTQIVLQSTIEGTMIMAQGMASILIRLIQPASIRDEDVLLWGMQEVTNAVIYRHVE